MEHYFSLTTFQRKHQYKPNFSISEHSESFDGMTLALALASLDRCPHLR
jgi:hypothetical protein